MSPALSGILTVSVDGFVADRMMEKGEEVEM